MADGMSCRPDMDNLDGTSCGVYVHIWRCIMRTNILLDDSLVEEALRLSSVRTKKEVIHEALKEFVENRKRLSLLDLSGKINFAEGYDYKTSREGR
jgi:Arc/MetJ family transcription regulator